MCTHRKTTRGNWDSTTALLDCSRAVWAEGGSCLSACSVLRIGSQLAWRTRWYISISAGQQSSCLDSVGYRAPTPSLRTAPWQSCWRETALHCSHARTWHCHAWARLDHLPPLSFLKSDLRVYSAQNRCMFLQRENGKGDKEMAHLVKYLPYNPKDPSIICSTHVKWKGMAASACDPSIVIVEVGRLLGPSGQPA